MQLCRKFIVNFRMIFVIRTSFTLLTGIPSRASWHMWSMTCGTSSVCEISGFSFVLLAIQEEEHYKNCALFDVVQHHVVISLLSVLLFHQQVFPVEIFSAVLTSLFFLCICFRRNLLLSIIIL